MRVSSKLRRICKLLNAAFGSDCRCLSAFNLDITRDKPSMDWSCTLDILIKAAYMCLRHNSSGCRVGQARWQSRTSEVTGSPQPTRSASPRPLVSGRSLLRCARSGAGQVRDAAAGQHRGRKKGRCRRALWRFPSNILSSRSGVRRARTRRLATPAARPPKSSQAHTRSDGVYRYTFARRTSAQRPRAISGDSDRAWSVCPSPQYRTRLGAQKKTVDVRLPPSLPDAMVATYEQLRSEALLGRTRPEGIGAVIYHGLLHGVALLCSAPDRAATRMQPGAAPRSPVLQSDLLRLLTNMVLQTQSEVMHVY